MLKVVSMAHVVGTVSTTEDVGMEGNTRFWRGRPAFDKLRLSGVGLNFCR